MFTVSDAVLLSLGQVTVTVTGTVPSCIGAVHSVCRSAGFASVPVGAVHRYVTAQPIESSAVAVTVELLPTSTVHGLHCAFTVSVCCGAGGYWHGSGPLKFNAFRSVHTGGGAGGTYVRTPG